MLQWHFSSISNLSQVIRDFYSLKIEPEVVLAARWRPKAKMMSPFDSPNPILYGRFTKAQNATKSTQWNRNYLFTIAHMYYCTKAQNVLRKRKHCKVLTWIPQGPTTTNGVESFHVRLNADINMPHPNIYIFIFSTTTGCLLHFDWIAYFYKSYTKSSQGKTALLLQLPNTDRGL